VKKYYFLVLSSMVLFLGACSEKNEPSAISGRSPSVPAATMQGIVIIPPDSPKLSAIRVDTVKTADVPSDEVTSPGKLEVNPNRVSRIILPVTGRITSVSAKIGDSVYAGQPMLTIESPDADAAESAYLQADAALTQSKSNLVKAQADFDRATDLYEHSAIAKKEVLSAENALVQAKAAVEQANAAKEQALRRVQILGLKPGLFGQKVVVQSPIAGKVLEMSAVPGEYRNDTNTPLMTVADLGTLWVSADVPESSIRLIGLGEKIQITLLAYPGEEFSGRVTRIADTVDPQTRTVKVRAELDNSLGRFRPEMFAQIRHTDSTQNVPVVPVGAVIQADGHPILYVEEAPGRFRRTTVELANRAGAVIPVINGLKPGDRIVVDGAMLLTGQ
jgi:membrane fusion protein, heavy metal efflux system